MCVGNLYGNWDLLKHFRVLDLRSRGSSSLEIGVTSSFTSSPLAVKPSHETTRLGLGSHTKYSSTKMNLKASRVLGTQLDTTSESFDSPVELGHIDINGIVHHATGDQVLNDPCANLNGIKIQVSKSVT
jgi:hypothetical protein